MSWYLGQLIAVAATRMSRRQPDARPGEFIRGGGDRTGQRLGPVELSENGLYGPTAGDDR